VSRRHEEDDPDGEVPPDMQARKCGVLVREAGRLKRAVGVRLIRDGVGEANVEQSRRCNRHEREEEEADSARDEERITQEVVAITSPDVQRDRRGKDHGPMAPDVDPVRERDQSGSAGDRSLDAVLPIDVQPSLEVDDMFAVREGLGRSPGRDVADREVGEDGACDKRRFAQKAVV
jgi:hypothetical protein